MINAGLSRSNPSSVHRPSSGSSSDSPPGPDTPPSRGCTCRLSRDGLRRCTRFAVFRLWRRLLRFWAVGASLLGESLICRSLFSGGLLCRIRSLGQARTRHLRDAGLLLCEFIDLVDRRVRHLGPLTQAAQQNMNVVSHAFVIFIADGLAQLAEHHRLIDMGDDLRTVDRESKFLQLLVWNRGLIG
jgi:hypothetical protein